MYYVNAFFVFSILGHFIESFFYVSGESGILLGYWTPIYGVGTVIILLAYDFLTRKRDFNKLKGIVIFLIGAIFLSLMEYIGGILIEKIFDVVFWDYSSMKFNIGKYTSLEMSFVWGLSSLALIYVIRPLVDRFIKKIPKLLSWVLIVLFIIDLILTLYTKLFI